MKKIKKKQLLKQFLNKILKNGEKYKYFKYLKNSLILFRIIKFFFLKKKMKYFLLFPNIFEEEILFWNYSEYGVLFKIKKKKKKKTKQLVGFILNEKNETKELYKLLYLLLFKLPIRSFQLKLLYIILVVNLHGKFAHNFEIESKKIFAQSQMSLKKKFIIKNKKFILTNMN